MSMMVGQLQPGPAGRVDGKIGFDSPVIGDVIGISMHFIGSDPVECPVLIT